MKRKWKTTLPGLRSLNTTGLTAQRGESPPVTEEYGKTEDPVHDHNINESIDAALQQAVRLGWIVDTGERQWSERTGRWVVVWESLIFDPVKSWPHHRRLK